jgi:hypothetical protein
MPRTSSTAAAELPLPAALQSKLELSDTETTVLLRLLTWSSLAREQVCTIVACGRRRPISTSSAGKIVDRLRAKLRPHKIKIGAINGIGFELSKEERSKIFELLEAPVGDQQIDDQPEPARSAAA